MSSISKLASPLPMHRQPMRNHTYNFFIRENRSEDQKEQTLQLFEELAKLPLPGTAGGSPIQSIEAHRFVSNLGDGNLCAALVKFDTELNLAGLQATGFLDNFEDLVQAQATLVPVYRDRSRPKLVVFDMDSTLIQQEVIDELARELNVIDQVSAITTRLMNGELETYAAVRERLALLKGTPVTVFDKITKSLTWTPGAKQLVRHFKDLGAKIAVISGGFTVFATWVQEQLELDYAFASTLGISDDGTTLNGEHVGALVDPVRKQELIYQLASKNGLEDMEGVIAIGDGVNDIPMMEASGLGIAYNAKPRAQELAPAKLNSRSMFDITFLLENLA